MPEWLQVLTYVIPARYFVASLQTVFLAGDVWAQFLPNIARDAGCRRRVLRARRTQYAQEPWTPDVRLAAQIVKELLS